MLRAAPPRLPRLLARIAACAALAALTACQPNEPQLRATAAYEAAREDFGALLASATVARARMQTTLDHAATRVVQAQEAGKFLRSNLINLGTDTNFIENSLAQLDAIVTPGSPRNIALGTAAAQPPIATLNALVTPPALSPSPATDAGPRLEDIVMASGVDRHDCAIDVNPRFTPFSSEIYVVARAFNIPAGAIISSSWQRSGVEVVSFSFDRAHEIDDSCIWFFIDQSDTPFTVGAWSVEIRVDGAPLASPVAFQIVGN